MSPSRALRVAGVLLPALVFALSAQAATFDLTGGGSAAINNALFTTADNLTTGTGVIQSFVRIQSTGTEQGYNTDARPLQFDENSSATFTRSLLLSNVPIVTIGGQEYREFLLDINQTGANPLLTLNEVQLWQRSAGNLTGFTAAPGCTSSNCSGTGFNSGTKVYGLDLGATDNNVELNYSLNAGSGSGDLFLYVLNSAFTGAGQYVYLYSHFGTGNGSNDGFEEWAVRTPGPTTTVPEPTALVLFGLVLTGAGMRMRKRTSPNV